MEKETIEEIIREKYDLKIIISDLDNVYLNGLIEGAKFQAERMSSEIEEKWLEYRNITNNEDAWCFKEWLVNEF